MYEPSESGLAPPARRLARWLGVLGFLLYASVSGASAQAPLFLVNDDTRVRKVSFKFVEERTFDEERLQAQIATSEPGFFEELKRYIPFLSPTLPLFDAIELQKDVERLRRFYRDHGFLYPKVDYPASQLDTTSNTIHVIFAIEEGPPLIIQDVAFYGPEGGYALQQFPERLRNDWIRFRDRTSFQTGERFTQPRLVLIQDEVLTWLQNRGYAFPQVSAETTIDSTYNVVDIRFNVDPGPLATVSEIAIEGNTSVEPRVLRRELPFQVGDRFDASDLSEGQRELFALNLFRLALADVPEDQPRDSTVAVRYRVREAELRYLTAETGYAREDGLVAQSSWEHRNFYGGARLFTVAVGVRSGFLANPSGGREPARRFNASVSLRQPYLFSRRVSGVVSPFYTWEDDPNQDLRFQELGIRETILYEIYPFRTISLQHSFGRAYPLGSTDTIDEPNIYNRNIVSLSGIFGWANEYLNPRRGYLIRPLLETAGALIGSGVQYHKAALETTGYLPITDEVVLSGRLYGGYLYPFGRSADQSDPDTEFRFDRIRFYTGGASDVRGWSLNFLGPKSARVTTGANLEGRTIDDVPVDSLTVNYEPEGGLTKVAANVELRLPFPGLGSKWRTAVFLDIGQTFPQQDESAPDELFPLDKVNRGGIDLSTLRFGTGVGMRYETLVGFIRLDLAMKLNPDQTDLYDAETLYRAQVAGEPLPNLSVWEQLRERLKLHLSIGQAF